MAKWWVGSGRAVPAAVALVASVAGLQAQELPAHSVTFDPAKAACRIVLEPDGVTGTGPARLVFVSDMLQPALAFGLDGSGIADAILISNGERHPFISQNGLSPADLRADPIWALFGAAADGAGSLYLTVRNDDGGYSSARYDRLSQDGILRLLTLACGAEGLDAAALTPLEFRAAEARLALSDANRLHIRKVLSELYGTPGTDVGDSGVFTVTDRRFIAQFNADEENPSGDYLWPAAVPDLLKLTVKQVAATTPAPPGETELARHGDWSVFADTDRSVCRIATMATAAEGLDTGFRMEFSVAAKGTGGMMAINLVTPNPFQADASLGVIIDGKGFGLLVEPKTGAVIPQPLADGTLSNDLTKALRSGKGAELRGLATATKAPARLSFSLAGFSAAFKDMAGACNRPGLMGWIE